MGVKCLAAIILLKDILVFAYYASTVTDDMERAEKEDYSRTIALLGKDDKCSAAIKLLLFYFAVFILICVDAAMAFILYIGVSRDKLTYLQAWSWHAVIIFVSSGVFLVDALLTNMKTVSLSFFGISFVLYGYTLFLVSVFEEDLKVQKYRAIRAQLVQLVQVVRQIIKQMNAIGNENAGLGRCRCPNCAQAQVVSRPPYPEIV